MRAREQPGRARISASTAPMRGCSEIAAGSRSLPCSASHAISADASALPGKAVTGKSTGCFGFMASKAANTSLVAVVMPGLTSTAFSAGRASGSERISPVPRMIRARGSRQTGTSAPTARAAARNRASPGVISLSRASSRNAAAASDEPPPNPAAAGRFFVSSKCPDLRAGMPRASAFVALMTRLSSTGPDCTTNGPSIDSVGASPSVRRNASHSPAKTTRLSMLW